MVTTTYVTESQFRAAIGDDTTLQAATVQAAIATASRQVDAICDRRFYLDTSTSSRVYWPTDWYEVEVDDIGDNATIVLATSPGYDGNYSQAWTVTTDFLTLPRNGLRGSIPWPTTGFRATGSTLWFPPLRNMFGLPYIETVRVTAKWGWSAVPEAVTMATLLLALGNYKAPEAPGGLLVDAMTGAVIRQRTDPRVLDMLGPYMKARVAVA